MYLCNVQHCIYKVHLNTEFASNTETTINRFDIIVFFFLSSAVFKWTQKCIFNNIQLQHITPTQLVHMQAKLFKCTMIDLRSEEVPCLSDSTMGTNTPTTHMHVCVRQRERVDNVSSCFCITSTRSPSSYHDEVRATRIHQVCTKSIQRFKIK